MRLSIVVPTYNERTRLGELVEAVFAVFAAHGIDGELVIVDDGSPDGTGALADDLATRHRIRVVHRPGKLGLGTAVIDGFAAASGEILGVMDADLSHPPEALPRLLAALEGAGPAGEGADMAIGSRYVPGGGVKNWPLIRRAMSRLACLLARPITPARDATSGYFLVRRHAVEGVQIAAGGFKICLELLVRGRVDLGRRSALRVQRSRGGREQDVVARGDRLSLAAPRSDAVSARAPGRAALRPLQALMTAPVRSLAIDDVTLAYRSAGSGQAVLCIQGVGVAGDGWNPQVDALAQRYRVITFDNRGVGATPRGTGRVTIERMAADAVAILDAEGIHRCHLLGHSMGRLIALAVALSAPARAQSLALLCTFADGAGPTRPTLRMIALGLPTRIGTRRMRRLAMQRMLFPDEYLRHVDRAALAERLNHLFGRDLGEAPPIVDEQLKAMGRYDATPRLSELAAIPTLVVSGRHDPIAPPAFGRAIAAGIPARASSSSRTPATR